MKKMLVFVGAAFVTMAIAAERDFAAGKMLMQKYYACLDKRDQAAQARSAEATRLNEECRNVLNQWLRATKSNDHVDRAVWDRATRK